MKAWQWWGWQKPFAITWLFYTPRNIRVGNSNPAAYLNADRQVESFLIYYDHCHNGLDHQGHEGVHSKHQGITLHTQINCNLKSIIKRWITFFWKQSTRGILTFKRQKLKINVVTCYPHFLSKSPPVSTKGQSKERELKNTVEGRIKIQLKEIGQNSSSPI